MVDRYGTTFGAFMDDALAQESDPRAGFSRMPEEAAVSYTDPGHPAGCLVISAATNYSPQTADVEQDLRTRRTANVRSFEARLQDAWARGALPEDADTRALAVYFAAVVQGMSQQARDGASTKELRRVARLAMNAWPEPSA
ncbi:TetR family transcriptional regulator C-terminal domain-containing protein [Streptomyces sp. NPDC014991]|uniref:TetR family transcriptional regulator C-terminal domain-containing protein n=1 Tax=Streptomyces sp. NPDC014991 TaxID=3364935 RepID=UPI0036F8EF3D